MSVKIDPKHMEEGVFTPEEAEALGAVLDTDITEEEVDAAQFETPEEYEAHEAAKAAAEQPE